MSNSNFVSRPVAESMTSEEAQNLQAMHYNMDDNIRRTMGRLTLEQKQKIHELMLKFITDNQEVKP